MATDLHPVKPAPVAKKYEAFVEAQLARARARIRSLDLAAAALGLLILTLTYGLVLALCDRWLELSPLARQTAFAVYAAGALVYLGLLVLRPLCRPINPYYAARRLEQTIPEAKNSVVNWLDLHQQAIAPAFRSAISHQAAVDLADADLEQAISARRASWLGACAAALFVSMLVLLVLGPRQFLSLMNRAFAPFVEAPIATRTRLLLVRPEEGDVTIPVGRAVGFSVWVEGRIPEASSPGALKLLYRYNLSDPYQTRLLERGDSSREWFTNLLASEVHNGLWYKIAGGDAETLEYRVQVRSTPLLTGFDVTYHYRPYLDWPDRTTHDQNLQDLRGTEVILLARTNRTVKDGHLVVDREKPIAAELVPEDPQVLRFHLRLEHDGSYRIWFKSVEEERNTEPMAYSIRVLQDHPPQLELTKPGEDSQLAANGVLRLEGSASDDFGITSLNLRMKVENGAALQPKPYRKGEALRRGDGSYPQMLAYRDFVELDKLQREDGRLLEPLRAGAKLEYWLEGTDNCDYPGPNIGESKHFTVTIQPADADKKKQEQARQEASQEQQKHQKKQDQDLQSQKRETADRSQDQNTRPPDADQPSQEGAQQNEHDLSKQKERIENAIKEHEQQQKAGEKGEAKGDQPQESKGGGQGEASSQHPADKAQNKGKEGGEGRTQPAQEKSGDKPETNREKGQHKGEGQAASESNGERGNQRGRQDTERRTDQGMTERNKERSEPAPNQNNGSNQTGKNPEDRPKGMEGGQVHDRANPKSEKGDKNTTTNNAGEKGRENAKSNKEQYPAGGQEKDSAQGEGKNASVEKAAKPNSQQGTAGEKADSRKEQNPNDEQKNHSGEADKEPRSNQENGKKAGANSKPEAGAEKTRKKGPGQEGSKQEAGQPMGEGKQGPIAEKAREKNQNQQAGSQQGGQKKEDSDPGRGSDKGQEKGEAELRADKSGGSQGTSKANNQAVSKNEGNAGSGQGDRGESKAPAKEKPEAGASEKAAKAQEKPSADKGDAGDRAAAKAEKKENSQNPATRGAQVPDKANDKGSAGSGPRQDDKARPQQPTAERQGAKEAGEESKDEVSALSEALKGRDEKGRAEARKKLEELRAKAKDPAARQAAADALERAGQDSADRPSQRPDGRKPGGSKGRLEEQAPSQSGENGPSREQNKGGDQNTATQKAGEGGTGQSHTSKGETKNANRTDPQGDSRSQTGERGSQPASPKQPGGSGAGSRPGSDPTAQAPHPNGSPDNPPRREQAPLEPPMAPNAAYQKRAGEMQLEDIKKKINKDVLKQLNMTEEDFRKFVTAYEEMLKRQQPLGTEKVNVTGPQRGNRSLPNQSVRPVDPREQAKSGNLQRLGPALAPPEFREAYREFSRQISELEQAKEKK